MIQKKKEPGLLGYEKIIMVWNISCPIHKVLLLYFFFAKVVVANMLDCDIVSSNSSRSLLDTFGQILLVMNPPITLPLQLWLNSIIAVFLQRWLWHLITREDWYAMKPETNRFCIILSANMWDQSDDFKVYWKLLNLQIFLINFNLFYITKVKNWVCNFCRFNWSRNDYLVIWNILILNSSI